MEVDMPKMKTKSSAKKRFFPLKSGKIKRGKCNLRHNLTHKQTTRKRNLRQGGTVGEAAMKSIKKMMPYKAK